MFRMEKMILCELERPEESGLESYSPFCLKVHRALHLQKAGYESRIGRSPASFRSLNPLGKIPVLIVAGKAIADSSAILQVLKVPGNAEAKLWEELADTALNGFLTAARWASDDNWPRVKAVYFRNMPRLIRGIVPDKLRKGIVKNLRAREIWDAGPKVCWQRFSERLDWLEERAPDQGFWLGERVDVADLALFAQLRSFNTDLTPWQGEQLTMRKRLYAYVQRVDRATA